MLHSQLRLYFFLLNCGSLAMTAERNTYNQVGSASEQALFSVCVFCFAKSQNCTGAPNNFNCSTRLCQ